jgi:hypothetical protein
MTETFNLTTPDGYVATIKSKLTYGEYEDIQDLILGDDIKVDADGKPIINVQALKAANQKILATLLVSIVKDGAECNLRDLPVKDGLLIKQKIDELSRAAQPEEKKGI